MHIAILGMTAQGKTRLAKELCSGYERRGFRCIVLDPLYDQHWHCSYKTGSRTEFLRVAKASKSCMLFIDEGGASIGRYADEMQWATTQARHWGHKTHVISQRAVQVDQTVRDQCTELYLFRVSRRDAKILADEWGQPDLAEAHILPQHVHFHTTRAHRSPERRKLKL